MRCRICLNDQEHVFSKNILGKYRVTYYRCPQCGFLQTEEPYWLQEAYSSVIASTDIGYVSRNIAFAKKVEALLFKHFDVRGKFLDYSGGYGLFVRLMRDKGFNCYWHDDYCKNLFAQYFELNSLDATQRHFDLVTGFEVMEHVNDPYTILDHIFEYTNSFLFSTELQPQETDLKEWVYLATEIGQHISFYTLPSLKIMAQRYGCQLYSNQKNLHLLTPKIIEPHPFQKPSRLSKWPLFRRIKRKPVKLKSLLQQDYEYARSLTLHSIKAS